MILIAAIEAVQFVVVVKQRWFILGGTEQQILYLEFDFLQMLAFRWLVHHYNSDTVQF